MTITNNKVRLADVMQVVCAGEGLTLDAMKSRSRKWEYSHPRQIGMALARLTTSASYPKIAQYFGSSTIRQPSTPTAR